METNERVFNRYYVRMHSSTRSDHETLGGRNGLRPGSKERNYTFKKLGKNFEDFPHLAQAAGGMLDDLAWWTKALKTAREAV